LTTLDLEASLVSRKFWESCGYVVLKEDYVPLAGDKRLGYFKMLKNLVKK
jgi:hypothetical protein